MSEWKVVAVRCDGEDMVLQMIQTHAPTTQEVRISKELLRRMLELMDAGR